MSKWRKFLLKLVKPKDYGFIYINNSRVHDDKIHGRYYVQMDESLRLYFEDGKYVGFSTGLPFVE